MWFGTSKGRKAIDMEIEKQMFGNQIFVAPCRDNVTQRGITNRLNRLC